MLRMMAIAALTIGVGMGGSAMAAGDIGAPQSRDSGAEERAAQLARTTLAQQLGIAADEIAVRSIEPRTWNDSSLGCGRRGAASLTVITSGYAVTLSAQKKDHRVHVAGENAVVCDRAVELRRKPANPAAARGLDLMIEAAKADLAAKLGVPLERIRAAGMRPSRWPTSAMDCPQPGETVRDEPVSGYRLMLKVADRVYTYHTDLQAVRACPAIETQ